MSVGSEGRSQGTGEQGFNSNQHQISCNDTAGEIAYNHTVGPLGCSFKFSLLVVTMLLINNAVHWFLLRWISLIRSINM